MVKTPYFIGIDNGTQSTKTIVMDGNTGHVVGKAVKGYGLVGGLPAGYKEQDAALWIDALQETIRVALGEAHVDPKSVKAIGVSGQQHGLVPLDKQGKVIRPVKLWNDTSTIEESEYLTKRLGGTRKVIELLGLAIPAGFTAPKVLWLKRHEPENYQKTETILLPHNYLNFYLTGGKGMEYGDASGTALMNTRTRSWCREVIEAIDPDLIEKLPVLGGSDQPIGTINKSIADMFGFDLDVLVSAGGGDNMMGAIGTGNTRKGVVTASLGTSGTIYAYSSSPVVDPLGEIAAFCDSTNAWLPLLCTMNVTVASEFVRNLFCLSYDELAEDVNEVPAGSDGLILLPYFEGERTPNVPDGTGVFCGLNNRTFDKAHFSRSAIEGATLGMNYGLNRMKKLGIEPSQIRLTGGGSKNKAWRQIAADVFGVEVVCLKIDEGAAYGAALQALWTYHNYQGEKTSIQEITDLHVEIDTQTLMSPNRPNVRIYREIQKLQDGLSRNLRGTFRRHRAYLNKHAIH